jgi:hypothetical protein
MAPGHPEQNGRHERFHLTWPEETTTPPATTPRQQQTRFDRMRREFNTARPHEALAQRPPARVYVASPPALPCAARGAVVRRDASAAPRAADGADHMARRAGVHQRSGPARNRRARRNGARRLARALHARGTGPHRSAHPSVYAGVARTSAMRRTTATVKTAVEMPTADHRV